MGLHDCPTLQPTTSCILNAPKGTFSNHPPCPSLSWAPSGGRLASKCKVYYFWAFQVFHTDLPAHTLPCKRLWTFLVISLLPGHQRGTSLCIPCPSAEGLGVLFGTDCFTDSALCLSPRKAMMFSSIWLVPSVDGRDIVWQILAP